MGKSKSPKKNQPISAREHVLQQNSIKKQQVEVVERSYSELHCGPLPDPHTLASYNQINDTFAERIMCMAEGEQSHRHTQENRIVKSETFNKKAGMACGFLIGVFTIGSGMTCVLMGP